MAATFTGKCAAIACAIVLCGTAAQSSTVNAFAAGKDGTHPRVVGTAPQSYAPDGGPRVTSDYQGIWQNAPAESEPGWVLAVEPDGDSIFATWFTYDTDGSPLWLAITAQDVASVPDSGFAPHTAFGGELYRAFAGPNADAALVAYGPAVIEFDTPDTGGFYYNVDGAWRSKTIERTFFADPVSACSPATDFRGLWTASEAGTDYEYAGGLHLAQQGDVIVATWYTYDAQGKGIWRVMAATRNGPNEYAGALYQARGPALTASFDPAQVRITAVGTGTLTFSDNDQGVFSHVVDGEPAALAISRQTLAMPVPACD